MTDRKRGQSKATNLNFFKWDKKMASFNNVLYFRKSASTSIKFFLRYIESIADMIGMIVSDKDSRQGIKIKTIVL